jgi:flagellin
MVIRRYPCWIILFFCIYRNFERIKILSINTNTNALIAANNLNKSMDRFSVALERLTSGLRINSAKDDAAGLAIATRMEGQVRGSQAGERNAMDAISMSQVADGGIASLTDAVQRIRELAVQSANAINTSSDRAALQTEAAQLIAEIRQIAQTTQFNGQNLLDGTFSWAQFQVGANAGQTITTSVQNFQPTELGSYNFKGINAALSSMNPSGPAVTTVANSVLAQTLTLSTINGKQSLAVSTGETVRSVAERINALSAMTEVTAQTKTLAAIHIAGGSTGNISFTLGSSQPGSTSAFISGQLTSSQDWTPIISAINIESASTGITAYQSTYSIGGTPLLFLKNASGEDIQITDCTSTAGGVTGFSGWDPLDDTVTGLVNTVTLTSGGTDSSTVGGRLILDAPSQFNLASSIANAGFVVLANSPNYASLNSLDSLDISTMNGATTALAITDAGSQQISKARANLEAIERRFEEAIGEIQQYRENLTAAESRIRDADYAVEVSEMARNQILQQAGTTILAQATNSQKDLMSVLLSNLALRRQL